MRSVLLAMLLASLIIPQMYLVTGDECRPGQSQGCVLLSLSSEVAPSVLVLSRDFTAPHVVCHQGEGFVTTPTVTCQIRVLEPGSMVPAAGDAAVIPSRAFAPLVSLHCLITV